MHDRSKLVPNDRTKLNMSHLANKHRISTLQTETHNTLFSDSDTMQTSTGKEYRVARKRSGEANWLCRQGTSTRGLCRRPARTFLDMSLVLRHLSPIWFCASTASTTRRICTRVEICMETSGLHAYLEPFVTPTSIAPCGHAKPETLARTKSRWADL